MGGHVGGYVGKEILSQSGEKIRKITALDPAGPLFTDLNRITANDADIVEIIHTNSVLGYHGEAGTVDFYPNGAGLVQPGCEDTDDTSPSKCLNFPASTSRYINITAFG